MTQFIAKTGIKLLKISLKACIIIRFKNTTNLPLGNKQLDQSDYSKLHTMVMVL